MRITRYMAALAVSLTPCLNAPAGTALADQLPVARWISAMEDVGLPGFAVAVVDREGIVYARGFGLRSFKPEKPFTAATSTYIASVTKVFTATAVVQLAEQGRIDLDAPVMAYLPRFTLKDAALARSITVRDLLCHRYGLECDPITFAEAYSGQIDDAKFYRELAGADAAGKWAYSNLHYTLLGRIIEAVSGQTWQDYLREKIFVPCGMVGATARAGELYGLENSAVPLVRDGGSWAPSQLRKSDSTMHAAGGMGASAEDLARWLQVQLNGGAINGQRILGETSLRAMLTPHTRPGTRYLDFERPEMGLGWYLGRYRSRLLVHHFGSYTGAHAHCSFMPEIGIGVAVVANFDDAARPFLHRVAADVYDAALGEGTRDPWPRLVRRIKKAIAQEERQARKERPDPGPLDVSLPAGRYTGTYTSDTWGALDLALEGGILTGHIGDFPIHLFPHAKDDFAIETPIGWKRMRFTVEGDVVTVACIPEFWGAELVFRREGATAAR